MNDLIVTTYGGAVFGEILHRLYLEAPLPAGVFISPMDALTNAVLGRKPRRTHNLYYFDVMSGSGYIKSNKGIKAQFNDAEENPNQTNIFTFNIGCTIIYGNPFIHQSKIPFSQFEIMMQAGGWVSPLWLDWTILIDGYLVSFNPVDTARDALSTGLSLHYDLITGSNTNFANQGLDWSVKWRHVFKTTAVELKAHLASLFLVRPSIILIIPAAQLRIFRKMISARAATQKLPLQYRPQKRGHSRLVYSAIYCI